MYKEKLKLLRKDKDLTQLNLADMLGITKARYCQFETESETIPLIHLNVLCNYFNVSLDYIFDFTDLKQYKSSINEVDKTIVGKRLKAFRKENKLTQVALATSINTVHPVIVNYEKGKFLINTSFLYDICKTYNVSADYLLGKIDEPKYLK